MSRDLLLKVHKLTKIFPVNAGMFSTKKLNLKAVDQVSFEIEKGETLGLVGESGCGKTTVGRSIIRLYEPEGGRVFIDPQEDVVNKVLKLDKEREELENKLRHEKNKSLTKKIKQLKEESDRMSKNTDILVMPSELLKKTRKRMQIVFQDPWASLNPRMLVKDIVGEGPKEFGIYKGRELDDWLREILNKVGLPPLSAERYPHEFSGGQRQRIGIARALALTPSLIVCDEPVSALDVSIQAQILNLLISLQDEFELTYIFIAHDLSVVKYVADRVAVMYLGRIAEIAESTELYENPAHPYTISLLSAVPVPDPDYKINQIILEGDVPSPINPPSGCTFHPRCRYVSDICRKTAPELTERAPGHFIACHNPQ